MVDVWKATKSALVSVVAMLTLAGSSAADTSVLQGDRLRAGPAALSCIAPPMAGCASRGREILASVLRVVFHGRYERTAGGGQARADRTGHATLVGPQTLVTHNHYGFVPASIEGMRAANIVSFSLYTHDHVLVLAEAPLTAIEVIAVETEALLLRVRGNVAALFAAHGLVEAPMLALPIPELVPGAEVAQIVWNGRHAVVLWTVVEAIHVDTDVPTLRLNTDPAPGSSGGGIWFRGAHVANTWSRVHLVTESGRILDRYSLAALNTPALVRTR